MAKAGARKKLPKEVAVINADNCTGCEACLEVCPVDCIVKVPGQSISVLQSFCEIDVERCEVRKNHEPVEVTASEFRLLNALIQAGGRVVSKDRLLEVLWDFAEADVGTRAVDMHISRLRSKIGHDLIRTVRGLGYRLAM